MKYCLFLDIDGTLISWERNDMLEQTKKDLRQAQAKGIKCFINTGRPTCSIPQCLKDFKFDGYCCACGGHIVYQGKELNRRTLTNDEMDFLQDIVMNHNVHILFEGIDYNVAYNQDKQLIDMYERMVEPFKSLTRPLDFPLSQEAKNQILKMTIHSFNPNDQWVDMMDEKFHFMKDCYIHEDEVVGEAIVKDSSKAKAIDIVMKELGSEYQSIAIGDGINDIEMLQHANISFWMANGNPSVQSYAQYTTDTVENNGVGAALRQLKLID